MWSESLGIKQESEIIGRRFALSFASKASLEILSPPLLLFCLRRSMFPTALPKMFRLIAGKWQDGSRALVLITDRGELEKGVVPSVNLVLRGSVCPKVRYYD